MVVLRCLKTEIVSALIIRDSVVLWLSVDVKFVHKSHSVRLFNTSLGCPLWDLSNLGCLLSLIKEGVDPIVYHVELPIRAAYNHPIWVFLLMVMGIVLWITNQWKPHIIVARTIVIFSLANDYVRSNWTLGILEVALWLELSFLDSHSVFGLVGALDLRGHCQARILFPLPWAVIGFLMHACPSPSPWNRVVHHLAPSSPTSIGLATPWSIGSGI